jgi:ribosomal protein L29
VCLKERNLLLTERLYFRQVGQAAPDPSRLHKVRRTMAMIKVVIGERARAAAMLEADKERAERVKSVGGAVVAALTGEGEIEGGAGAAAAAGAAAPAASTPAPSGSVSLDVAKKNAQKAVKARLQSKVR